jgi:hypothetical protein
MKEKPNPGGRLQKSHRRLFDITVAAISVIVIGLLPFAILSFFSHPQADDFDAATSTMRMGYFKAIAFTYMNWNSRWFSAAIMQASPLVFNSIYVYKALPIMLLFLFVWALFAFVKAILPEIKRPREAWLCALALSVLYLSSMPSVAQGFYWMPGAIGYQLANIMMLFLWAHLAGVLRSTTHKSSRWTLIFCTILIFAITGSNQISLILILFMLAATLVWRLIQYRRMDRLFVKLLILAAIAAAIVALAPGNHARMERASDVIDLLATTQKSIQTMTQLATDQVNDPLLLLLTICAIPYFAAKVKSSNVARPVLNPLVLSVLWICSMLATVAPIIHLFPEWTPKRILNVTCLLFILGWFLILYEIIRYWGLKRSFRITSLPVSVSAAMILVIALAALTGKNNIRTAWENLLSGDAYRYDRELRQRYEKITGCAQDICVVPPLSVFPGTLYYKDIDADPESWPNKPYAEYFGKQAVMLGKPE